MSAAVHISHPIITSHSPAAASPQLDELTLFGFLAVFLSMVLFLHQNRSRSTTLALAICLAATAVYAFTAGPWPLGLIQLVFAASSFRQWWFRPRSKNKFRETTVVHHELYESESRISRMFGSA